MDERCIGYVREKFQPALSSNQGTEDAKGDEAFGQVSFYGPKQIDTFFHSKFVRFDPRQLQSHQDALDLLFNYWHLSEPRLLISVTGGARRFIMHDKLRQFNRSLLRAATSADALIITNGLWKGVTRLIGEAAQSLRYQEESSKTSRVQLLGIASWGVLQETNSLLNSNFPSHHEMKRYRVYDNSENDKVPASLDPNHDAFLLIDTGNFRKYGDEIPFRNDFEDSLLQYLGGESSKTPGVLLVLEGGETTLKTTVEFLRKGRPVVVVYGVGGAGDLISYAYRVAEGINTEASTSSDEFAKFSQTMARECPHWKRYFHFKNSDEKSKADAKMLAANTLLFEACVSKRYFVSVVSLDDAHMLDSAILESNFKASVSSVGQLHSDPFQLLRLAIQWNRSDIAKAYVFTSENMSDPAFFSALNTNYYDLFLTAMNRNFDESTITLLQNGFNLAGPYFTLAVLGDMYKQVLSSTGSETRFVEESLRKIICRLTPHNVDGLASEHVPWVIGTMIADLVAVDFPNLYETFSSTVISIIRQNKEQRGGRLEENMVQTRDRSLRPTSIGIVGATYGEVEQMAVEYPQRDFFIFCVLLNRRDMAQLMWRQFTNGGNLAGALLASTILHGLANKASNTIVELAQSLRDHADFWEKTARKFVEHCFELNPPLAQMMLIRAVPEFGNKTPLQLAHAAGLKQFMCASCCYTKLNVNWCGHMTGSTPAPLILATALCPLFLPLIKFRLVNGEENEKRRLSKVGTHPQPNSTINRSAGAPSSESVWYRRVSLRVSPTSVGFFHALIMFYTSPVTKFVTHAIAYAIYLLLFSFFVLTNSYQPYQLGVLEVILWLWTAVLMFEESRQIIVTHGTVKLRLQLFWASWWHRVDILAFLLFIAAAVCHVAASLVDINTETASSPNVAALNLYNLSLVIFFTRLLNFFYVSRILGPQVIALFKMIVDVSFFIAIYIVLLLAFGIPIQSLLYPSLPFTWKLFEVVIYDYVLILFGLNERLEPKVRGREELECVTYNETDPSTYSVALTMSARCPRINYLAIVLLCAYLVTATIVLINLLIALFSFTFNNIADVSLAIWRFNMYEFVLGYYNKSSLAPPLALLEHVYMLTRFCIGKVVSKAKGGDDYPTHRRSSPFVLYDDELRAIPPTDSVNANRRAYEMTMLVRLEASTIEFFSEEKNNFT